MGPTPFQKQTYSEWLIAAAQSQRAFDSVHVDELEIPGLHARGLELVRDCCTLLEAGRRLLATQAGGERVRYLLAHFPLGASESLFLWDASAWDAVGADREPPSLYVMCRDQVLTDWDEEYRRPVDVPLPDRGDIFALYRCWRTRVDMQNAEEFYRGLFLELDLRGPSR